MKPSSPTQGPPKRIRTENNDDGPVAMSVVPQPQLASATLQVPEPVSPTKSDMSELTDLDIDSDDDPFKEQPASFTSSNSADSVTIKEEHSSSEEHPASDDQGSSTKLQDAVAEEEGDSFTSTTDEESIAARAAKQEKMVRLTEMLFDVVPQDIPGGKADEPTTPTEEDREELERGIEKGGQKQMDENADGAIRSRSTYSVLNSCCFHRYNFNYLALAFCSSLLLTIPQVQIQRKSQCRNLTATLG